MMRWSLLYTHWYLPELGLAWDRRIGDEKLMDHWQLPGIPLQHSFYEKRGTGQTGQQKGQTGVCGDFRCPAL